MVDYSYKEYNENMARAIGRELAISTKASVEICNYIRKRNLQEAKELLKLAKELKKPIPVRRFTEGAGHKKGIGSGKYYVKASSLTLKLLESVEANALSKGLNVNNLIIKHICAHKASTPLRYGRLRRRQMKRTHIEVVVEEKADKKSKASIKKEEKAEQKKEIKKEATQGKKESEKAEEKKQESKAGAAEKEAIADEKDAKSKKEAKDVKREKVPEPKNEEKKTDPKPKKEEAEKEDPKK